MTAERRLVTRYCETPTLRSFAGCSPITRSIAFVLGGTWSTSAWL
jgi:hypothetical protein